MELKSIAEEAAACREAFKGSKVGDPVWLCHHEVLVELLTEEPEARISYILKKKPENERALRLRLFRPIDVSTLPEDAKKALVKYLKAQEEYFKASEARYKHWAGVKYYEGEVKYIKAWKKRNKARKGFFKLVTPYYRTLFPDSPWNGKTIFPQE